MLRRLPTCEHLPAATAGPWLVVAALVLIPVDLALHEYMATHTDEVRVSGSVIHFPSSWVLLARIAVPLLGLTLLICLNKVLRRDVGLTMANSHVTWFWVIAPVVVAALAGLVIIVLGIAIMAVFDLPQPKWLGEPMSSVRPSWRPADVWRYACIVCVLSPLREDILYRAILTPALERLGGWWSALFGSGLAWAGLHCYYGHSVAEAPGYFAWGMFGGWVFLKSRSLVPVYMHHALGNAALIGYDVVILWFSGVGA